MARQITALLLALCLSSVVPAEGKEADVRIHTSEAIKLATLAREKLKEGVSAKYVELFLAQYSFESRFDDDKEYFGEDDDDFSNLINIKGRYLATSKSFGLHNISYVYMRIYIDFRNIVRYTKVIVVRSNK